MTHPRKNAKNAKATTHLQACTYVSDLQKGKGKRKNIEI
jgi:hypothetical protein